MKTRPTSRKVYKPALTLHQYASDRGWTVCAEYIDDDRSGADADERDFKLCCAMPRQDTLMCCFAKRNPRFTRDLELSEHYLHRRFSEWGVRFISVVDGVDPGRRDNLKRVSSEV